MQLYMFRHAESPPQTPGQSDFDRPLTRRGIERTKQAGRMFKVLEIELTKLYSSPLVRARHTAELLGQLLRVPVELREELGYEFNITKLGNLLEDSHEDENVMCVGHEPSFSAITKQVCGGDVVFKRGGLARLDLRTIAPPRGELVWLIQPSVYELFE